MTSTLTCAHFSIARQKIKVQNGRKYTPNGRKYPQTRANPKSITNPVLPRALFDVHPSLSCLTLQCSWLTLHYIPFVEAMLSNQWSSCTLKDGIGLLDSQCNETPDKLAHIDELIKVH